MDEPWQIYYEELFARAEDVPDHEFNRDADMAEAAHEAYESTVDRLVNQLDHAEDDALALARAFGRAVKGWIAEGHWDWDDLQDRLEAQQERAEGTA